MLRPSTAALRTSTKHLANLSRPTIVPATTRLFSTSLAHRAEGDTGATRSGGAQQSDAFSKREKANEDKFVKEQEMKKLHALRDKLKEQQSNIQSLQSDIDKLIDEGNQGQKK